MRVTQLRTGWHDRGGAVVRGFAQHPWIISLMYGLIVGVGTSLFALIFEAPAHALELGAVVGLGSLLVFRYHEGPRALRDSHGPDAQS
jgi:hypothetical protein